MDRLLEVERELRASGLRLTGPRRLVVRQAVAQLHFTAEELVHRVRAVDASVARGTIYRTLALLHQAGVVEKHDFRYGPPYYEVTYGKAHHDHLMCVRCGEIIEFTEPRVEQLQDQIVKRYGYRLMAHTHKLYGVCGRCQRARNKRPPARTPSLHVEEVVA